MRETMSLFTQGLINVLTNPVTWAIAGPFLALRLTIRFLHWTSRQARGGPELDELTEGYREMQAGYGNRMHYGRDYVRFRRQGLSERDLYRERTGRKRW